MEHDLANALSRDAGVLVFPDPHDGPAGLGQPAVGVAVPSFICRNLRSPEFGVRRGDGVVFWAPMPETPVQEHRHLMAGKDEVGGAPYVFKGAYRHAVAKAEGMNR